jgi:ribose transport system ATP-binding protein
VCDRAYVMRDKAIVGELGRRDLTEENILRMAMHHDKVSSLMSEGSRV